MLYLDILFLTDLDDVKVELNLDTFETEKTNFGALP